MEQVAYTGTRNSPPAVPSFLIYKTASKKHKIIQLSAWFCLEYHHTNSRYVYPVAIPC
jgi:hypothetical protein